MATKKRKKKRTLFKLAPRTKDSPAAMSQTVWNDLLDGLIDPDTLTVEQRRAATLAAMSGENNVPEIAAILHVSPKRVRADIRYLRREIGEEYLEATFAEVLGDLVHTADICLSQAMKAGHTGLAWKIKEQQVNLMLKMGLSLRPKEAEKKEITGRIDVVHTYERAKQQLADLTDPALTGEIMKEGGQRGKLKEVEVEAISTSPPSSPGEEGIIPTPTLSDTDISIIDSFLSNEALSKAKKMDRRRGEDDPSILQE